MLEKNPPNLLKEVTEVFYIVLISNHIKIHIKTQSHESYLIFMGIY